MNIEASTGAAASSPPISAPWIPESFPVDDLNGIKAVYEALSTLPSLSSGSLLNVSDTTLDVQAVTTQRDHLSKAKRKSSIAYAVSLDGQKVAGARRVGFPTEMSPQIVASMPGPNGLLVTLRIVNEKEKKRRFVETSNDAGVLERIEVTETHGDFYADEFFGGIGWSADGRKIAYVAEGNLPTNGVPSFLYQQGWGERYSDKKGRPTLVVVDLDKKKATALDLGTISPGQPRFIDGDAVLLFHALKEDPMKHGSIYCFNRLGGLFTCALDGSNLVKITSEEGARCPRVTADGKGLFYLTNPVTNGTHNSCAKLVKMQLTGSKASNPSTVVDIVSKPASRTDFPGLYTDNLHPSCLMEMETNSSTYLICNTMGRSQRVIVAIDTASGTVHRLAGEEGFSYSILDIKNGWLLATVQSPCTPAKLMLGALTSQGSQIAVDWTPLPAPPLPIEAQQILSSFTSTTRAYDDFVEAIILKPKSQDRRISLLSNFSRAPLVSTPHGGPNSAYATDFMLYPACLAALGFGVACINFTGSIGFGQKSIDDLIGKCGELDVHDTHLCTARAIEEEGFDPEAVFLTGGSHGGFISGHMIAKHPDLFRATVMRNPVINMGAMVLTSDIPSWSFEESGLPYDFDKPAVLTPTLYDQLYKSSPIAGIDAVQTPVLLMLGDIDRRVPPQDGLNYLHYLRSRGKEAHCLWFPDNGHPLDGMDAEARGFEAMATFFLSHLPAK